MDNNGIIYQENANLYTVCLIAETISDLWGLDVTGVKDPVDVKPRKLMEEKVPENFKGNLK